MLGEIGKCPFADECPREREPARKDDRLALTKECLYLWIIPSSACNLRMYQPVRVRSFAMELWPRSRSTISSRVVVRPFQKDRPLTVSPGGAVHRASS